MRASRVIHAGLLLLAGATGCGGGRGRPAPVARAWEAMGSVLTAAAWGPDSTAVGQALARAFDSVRLADSGARAEAAGVLGRQVARISGASLGAGDDSWRDLTARGLALDRAALALGEEPVDSAVLDFGGLYLFYFKRTTNNGMPGDGARGGGARTIGIPDPDNAFRPIAVLTLPPPPPQPSPPPGGPGPGGGVVSVRTAVPDPDAAALPHSNRKSLGAGARSATAVAGSAADAAVWSVAFLALGCDRALAVAGRAAVGLICVDAAGPVRWSPDLDGRVRGRD